MVDRNTVVVDRSPQAADPRSEKTTDSRSPQTRTQKCNIQEINNSEDDRKTHKTYHFENCGTVYMDSFNAYSVRMENCGNNTPKVTYHRPGIIGNEKFLHSQSHAVSSGPQNATGPPTVPTENTKSKHSNVDLQMDAISLPQSPRPMLPSQHDIKHLEQLLDSSLATVAVIQFSGSPLPDVLTPRAYDTFKALYALVALDAPASSTKSRESEIPTRPTFSDIGNDCPYSNNRSHPLPNSSLADPGTGRIHVHILIPVDYVMILSWAGLAAVSCLAVFFNLPRICERIFLKWDF